MDRTRECDLKQCCDEYEKQFGDFLKSMAITKATPKNHPLYIAERNQSVYFFNAVKSVYSDATAWFEFPFNTNEHLDALIYIPKDSNFDPDQVLLVESKNMRTLSIKVSEMLADVRRIGLRPAQKEGALKAKLKALFVDFSEISFFGVILCDVQKTSEEHGDLAKQWENAVWMEQFINKKINSEDRSFVKPWLDSSTAKRFTQKISGERHNGEELNYEQLIRYWPIKNINE